MRPLRPLEYPLDRCVTGPHAEQDEGGRNCFVWVCELCGTRSSGPRIREGCWNCDAGVLWR